MINIVILEKRCYVEAFDFGLRLKDLRENRNLSQIEVASRLNVERATISGYERNVTTPSLDILKKLALLYNTSSDYLLGLTGREIIFLDNFTDSGKNGIIRIIDTVKQVIVEETKNKS